MTKIFLYFVFVSLHLNFKYMKPLMKEPLKYFQAFNFTYRHKKPFIPLLLKSRVDRTSFSFLIQNKFLSIYLNCKKKTVATFTKMFCINNHKQLTTKNNKPYYSHHKHKRSRCSPVRSFSVACLM